VALTRPDKSLVDPAHTEVVVEENAGRRYDEPSIPVRFVCCTQGIAYGLAMMGLMVLIFSARRPTTIELLTGAGVGLFMAFAFLLFLGNFCAWGGCW